MARTHTKNPAYQDIPFGTFLKLYTNTSYKMWASFLALPPLNELTDFQLNHLVTNGYYFIPYGVQTTFLTELQAEQERRTTERLVDEPQN